MKILVAHPDFAVRGGAEDYALRVAKACEALGHDVQRLDISDLNLSRVPGLRQLSLLKHALVCRAAARMSRRFDRVIFTYGEGPDCACPRIEIRHAPSLFSARRADLDAVGCAGRGPYFRLAKTLNAALARGLAGPRNAPPAFSIANSRWTLARAGLSSGRAQVVYPKVDAGRAPQGQRIKGRILSLGRLVRNKRHDEAIWITRRLREAGIAASLDIIGRGTGAEVRRLRRLAGDSPFIRILPDANSAERTKTLAEAEIGLHCYRNEHFGIAVGEMIAAGVLPVVFKGGGVTELVPDPDLQFETPEEAVERIARLLAGLGSARVGKIEQLQRTDAFRRALSFDIEIRAALAPALGNDP